MFKDLDMVLSEAVGKEGGTSGSRGQREGRRQAGRE